MSKYLPLAYHLNKLPKGAWNAKFADIEKIVGFPLPASARRYQAWWANNDQSHVCAIVWLKAGWKAENLNLKQETVTFMRANTAKTPVASRVSSHAIKREGTELSHVWDVEKELNFSSRMKWKTCGRVLLKDGMLVFPVVADSPAIYRFTMRCKGNESVYIGETKNFKSRLVGYRTPEKTNQQPTNTFMQKFMTEVLSEGGEISLAMLTDIEMQLNRDNAKLALASKVVRCALENIALLEPRPSKVKVLNKHFKIEDFEG